MMSDETTASEPPQQFFRRSVAGLLFVLAFGMGYAIYQWTSAVPGCNATETKKLIHSMLSRIPVRMGDAPAVSPTLSEIKEVGYASASRQRGCTGTVKYEDETIPYAYIVSALTGEKSGYSVASAHPAIVQARFGKVGEDGELGNQAAPIGRAQLESVLRAAIDEMHGPRTPVFRDPRKTVEDIFNHVDPDRTREIADLEPIGACRAVTAGTRYACRVMIERNDPMMSIIGMPADILDAEFTFERDNGTATWHMSEDFGARFSDAIVKARSTRLLSKKET